MLGAVLRWGLFTSIVLALVLVPFLLFEESIARLSEASLQGSAGRLSVGVAVVLLLASDLFVPVPSSLVATASGLLLGLVPGIAATWVGMQSGALAGYGVGRLAGRRVAARIVGEPELQRAARAYDRWGGLFLIASRAVPVLAEASVVIAGVASMPLLRFFGCVGMSNLAIAAVYAGVGAYVRDVNTFLMAFAASILLPGSLMLAHRTLAARAARRSAASQWGQTV
ncbi:MAG: VTT domain-containing protein [Bryobacterales bacterium]|nr:VTT domain-containing protein [Bryobacterales bacterium]MDE0627176.1 VTT domain-containing protein [Bryobacterales bacterium]